VHPIKEFTKITNTDARTKKYEYETIKLNNIDEYDITKGKGVFIEGEAGTGKTTLSSDPHRSLIVDEEHVWTDKGLFNIEGGCYAKCDGLKFEKEPEIFKAVKFGAVLENCKYFENDPDQKRTINYDDVSLTENTRVCYPLEHIENVRIPAIAGHPKNVIFLTCDATGVLPPVALLSPE
jgi:phosphoenolpyruvate carboxykinase (ATP)